MIKTSEYKYFKCQFDYFNPIQEACYPYFTKDCNIVVASSLASGKTTIAECILGYELTKSNIITCYISPLRELTKEKFVNWKTNNVFGKKNKIDILSSDNYLLDMDIVHIRLLLSTIEALDVRIRKQAEWIKKLSCLIFDEAHLLGDSRRGSDAESLLMNLTNINPDCRIIFLSGTLSNAREIAKWLKFLNNKETKLISSEWTPTKVEKRICQIEQEEELYSFLLSKVKETRNKIIIFVHSKRKGERIVKFLLQHQIQVAFFHSDLEIKRKNSILRRFSDNNNLQVLVSTNALSMGLNL